MSRIRLILLFYGAKLHGPNCWLAVFLISDLKHSIVAGKRPSRWAELLQQKAHPNRKSDTAPNDAMTGIMEEFILGR